MINPIRLKNRMRSLLFYICKMFEILVWPFEGKNLQRNRVWERLELNPFHPLLTFSKKGPVEFHHIIKARWSLPLEFPQVILPVLVTSSSSHPFSTPDSPLFS